MNSSYRSNNVDPTAFLAFMGAYIFFIVGILAFTIFCLWRIFSKAGFSGWMSLLVMVPCGNIILLIWFAFSEWPIERQMKMMGGGGAGPMGPGNYYRPPGVPPVG